MKKTYRVGAYFSISNSKKLTTYAALAFSAINVKDGNFLARDMPDIIEEAGQNKRNVLVELDSLEGASAVYYSPAYQESVGRPR